MDNIKVLEEIGLKKVSDETHIELKYIKYMVDGEFEKLNRINTLGFAKILSREYNVDLDAWVEAFEEYWTENRANPEKDEKLFIVVDSGNSRKKFLFFLLIVLLVAVGGFSFAIFKEKIDFTNYQSGEEESYNQTSLVEETKKSLEVIDEEASKSGLLEDSQNEEHVFDNDQEVVVADENITQEIQEEVVQSTETVIETTSNETSQEVTEEVIHNEKNSKRFANEAILIPQAELWIGVIYLDNKIRRSYLGEGNFSLNLERNQIVTTGHGSFTLNINNEEMKYRRESPVRLLIEDGVAKEISWSKFKELNEGKPW